MHAKIDQAIKTFSPKHYHLVREAALPLGGDVEAVAATVRRTLEGANVHAADFPNPFRGEDYGALRDRWAAGWAGEAAENDAVPTKLPEGVEGWTKLQIDEWAARRGINLDRRLTKPDMIEELRLSLEANRDPIDEDAAREPSGEPGGDVLPQ